MFFIGTPLQVCASYLKTIKGSVIFKHQDMIRDWEDVAMGSNQASEVNGFSCCQENGTQKSTEMSFFLN